MLLRLVIILANGMRHKEVLLSRELAIVSSEHLFFLDLVVVQVWKAFVTKFDCSFRAAGL